ncbi:MAG: Gfo/Idh/MocA family oxidoreductase [Armatimonadetes bacterium]|nr:Gfo/Idh/MocA family oxidoreductase [Armatimonadota bacterium]
MKAAVIGAGAMGRRHLQAVQSLGLEMVGVCDRRAEALAALETEAGIPRARHFTDAAALLNQTAPECVVIATTADSHCELTCRAAEAGARFIVCEKPMAVSLEQCDRMVATCQRQGSRLAINHPHRFVPLYAEMRRRTQSEEFGGLSSVTIVAGNIGMAMNGAHLLELFRLLTDEEEFEVTAWLDAEGVPNPRGVQFEDAAGCLRVVTPRGARLYADMGAAQGHGLSVICAGRYGQLMADALGGTLYQWARQPEQRSLPTTRYGAPGENTVTSLGPADAVAAARAVLEALLSGSGYPTGEQGRLVVRSLVAAHVSAEAGSVPIGWDAQLPAQRVFPWA